MMSGHFADLIKIDDWTSSKLAKPPPPTSDNLLFLPYPHPVKVGIICV